MVHACPTGAHVGSVPPLLYVADDYSYSDYYPYGMPMVGRNTNLSDYRFGYQGSEMDNEHKGNGNSYTTFFRQYDPRLGRWMSIDPLAAQFAFISPYAYSENNPIVLNDPEGDSPCGPGDKKAKKECDAFGNKLKKLSPIAISFPPKDWIKKIVTRGFMLATSGALFNEDDPTKTLPLRKTPNIKVSTRNKFNKGTIKIIAHLKAEGGGKEILRIQTEDGLDVIDPIIVSYNGKFDYSRYINETIEFDLDNKHKKLFLNITEVDAEGNQKSPGATFAFVKVKQVKGKHKSRRTLAIKMNAAKDRRIKRRNAKIRARSKKFAKTR